MRLVRTSAPLFYVLICLIGRDICVALCPPERAETREHLEERLGRSVSARGRQQNEFARERA